MRKSTTRPAKDCRGNTLEARGGEKKEKRKRGATVETGGDPVGTQWGQGCPEIGYRSRDRPTGWNYRCTYRHFIRSGRLGSSRSSDRPIVRSPTQPTLRADRSFHRRRWIVIDRAAHHRSSIETCIPRIASNYLFNPSIPFHPPISTHLHPFPPIFSSQFHLVTTPIITI